MYGDMQGLMGSTMQNIPAMESGEEKPEEENIELDGEANEVKDIPL
jgi:hypothetical protein